MSEPPLPNTFLKPHHVRHLISGSIVFILCVATDIALLELKSRIQTHQVQWMLGDTQTNFTHSTTTITPGQKFEVGLMDDGSLLWRPLPLSQKTNSYNTSEHSITNQGPKEM